MTQQKLKVLFITRKWPPAIGGMETYSKELTQELSTLTDLTIHYLPGEINGSPPSAIKVLFFYLQTGRRLWKEKNKYDIIHFGDFVLYPLAWLHSQFTSSSRRIITVHGLDLIYGNRKGIAPRLYRLFIQWAKHTHSKTLHAIITNSQNTTQITTNAGFGESHPIPLGVHIKNINIDKTQKSNERYLLFVGRLVKRKGASWFVNNVLPLLPADVHLKVIGKVWDKNEAEILQKSNRVELLGYVEEQTLHQLRANATAIIMPNITSPGDTDVEGFGIAALEASASGTPLIASNLEGITDAVKHNETGFLVPTAKADRWLTQITDILTWTEAQRETFSNNAINHLKKEYSWTLVANNTYNIYKSL